MISLKAATAGAIGALALMLTLVSPPSTHAQQAAAPSGKGAGMAACRADMATHCKGVEAGGGARIRCLVQNEAKLQPDCRATVQDRLQKRAERRQAAPQVAAAGPLAAAPKDQNAPLPPSGAPALPAQGAAPAAPSATPMPPQALPSEQGPAATGRKGNGPGPLAACRNDMRALCTDVQPGGGARIRCLTENSAKVSAACQDALAVVKQRRAQNKGG